MSGTYPSTPAFAGVKIISWQPTFVSWSHSLQRQVRSRGGAQRWAIEATYPPNLTRAEMAPLLAFALAQRGQYETFTLYLPTLWGAARGIATGSPKVNGGSQTGRSVTTDGWTPDQTGILLAGDFCKFAGQDKVYLITADTNSDGLGCATLTIEPALLASPENNAAITVNSVPFLVSFASDVQEMLIKPAYWHEFTVSFLEAL